MGVLRLFIIHLNKEYVCEFALPKEIDRIRHRLGSILFSKLDNNWKIVFPHTMLVPIVFEVSLEHRDSVVSVVRARLA